MKVWLPQEKRMVTPLPGFWEIEHSAVVACRFYGCYLAVLPTKGNQMFLTLILFEMKSSTEQINLSPSEICTDFESQIL